MLSFFLWLFHFMADTLYQTRLFHHESVPMFVTVLSVPINHEYRESIVCTLYGWNVDFYDVKSNRTCSSVRFLLRHTLYQRIHHIQWQAGLAKDLKGGGRGFTAVSSQHVPEWSQKGHEGLLSGQPFISPRFEMLTVRRPTAGPSRPARHATYTKHCLWERFVFGYGIRHRRGNFVRLFGCRQGHKASSWNE